MFFPAWFTAKNRLQEIEKEYRRKQERVLDCKKKKKKEQPWPHWRQPDKQAYTQRLQNSYLCTNSFCWVELRGSLQSCTMWQHA